MNLAVTWDLPVGLLLRAAQSITINLGLPGSSPSTSSSKAVSLARTPQALA